MSFLTKLKNDRASIILETALCLPLYFVLLIFLVDVPQIMAHRQSLLGLARLDADIKARNFGFAPMLNEDLCKRLFWNQSNQIQSVELMGGQQEDIVNQKTNSKLAEFVEKYTSFKADESDGVMATALKFLGNTFKEIMSGNSITTFLNNVFATDIFYRSNPRIAINTILPPEFYAMVMDLEVDKNLYVACPYDCWQPSGNTAQNPGQTPLGSVGDKINKAIGWVKKFISLPNFD